MHAMRLRAAARTSALVVLLCGVSAVALGAPSGARPKWLRAADLQGSGIAVVGKEVFVAGDRSSAEKNTILVFERATFDKSAELVEPVRRIVLNPENTSSIADPNERKEYEARICSGVGCSQLDIEDLAIDRAGMIYVSVEGRADAVIKFDSTTLRPIDAWQRVTGDTGGLGAEGLAVSPDGELLFVGRQNPPEVAIINTKTGWVSRGPIDVDQVNGLAYDASHRRLLVLDGSRAQVAALTLEGVVTARYSLAGHVETDPSGQEYLGRKLDGMALDAAQTLWLVTDPPHGDDNNPYKPATSSLTEPYTKAYSMIYRLGLVSLKKAGR